MLANRIIIYPFHNESLQIPKKRFSFYREYALFIRNTLKKPLFQHFLRWLLKRENIEKLQIKSIQIKVLPHQEKNGNSLAGRRKKDGRIFIFPINVRIYKMLVAKHGNDTIYSFVKSRARATLIHEILHIKYSSDEEKVRRLTENYYDLYVRNPKTEDCDNIIFGILSKR